MDDKSSSTDEPEQAFDMTATKLLIKEGARAILSPVTHGQASQLIRPSIATVYLTKRCNSRCTFCDFWKNGKDPKELSSEQWGVIFSRLKAFGVGYIGVNASGEMLFRPDSLKILTHLHNLDMPFGINSNGLLLHGKRAQDLAQLAPRQITIGMDGYGDDSYLRTRGIKGGFAKVTKNILELKSLGIENISLGTVLMVENMNDWIPLAEFALHNGLSGIRYTAYHDNYFNPQSTPSGSQYKKTETLELIEREIRKLISLKRSTGIVRNSETYLLKIIDFYKNQTGYFPTPCLQGSNRIEIDIHGNVTLCSFVTEPLGNLVECEMETIWRSETHRKARDAAYQGKCPHCFLSCYAEENLRLSTRYFLPTITNSFKRGVTLLGSS